MNIGILAVDGHNFPNFALMRASAYHKARGDQVEWATPFNQYDKVMASKVFTFTPDFNYLTLNANVIEKGGTGYNIARWANKMWLFKSFDFADFSPRKGFKCSRYFN